MATLSKELLETYLPENYETLTSVVIKNLKSINGIADVSCEEREACTEPQIRFWEQSHAISLPEDLKRFYLVCNGFEVRWRRGDGGGEGRLGVRGLGELRRVGSVVVEGGVAAEAGSFDPRPRDPSFAEGAVIEVDPGLLIHLGRRASAWFVDPALDWHPLAPSFDAALRLMILYQGVPYWMYAFTPYGLPACSEGLLSSMAPHLLEVKRPLALSRYIAPPLPSAKESDVGEEEEEDEDYESESESEEDSDVTEE